MIIVNEFVKKLLSDADKLEQRNNAGYIFKYDPETFTAVHYKDEDLSISGYQALMLLIEDPETISTNIKKITATDPQILIDSFCLYVKPIKDGFHCIILNLCGLFNGEGWDTVTNSFNCSADNFVLEVAPEQIFSRQDKELMLNDNHEQALVTLAETQQKLNKTIDEAVNNPSPDTMLKDVVQVSAAPGGYLVEVSRAFSSREAAYEYVKRIGEL